MPEYLAPGVYVEETSFRAKSIEGVGTSTTGFVGPTRKGPIGEAPELITSFNDFERIYGGLENLGFGPNYLAHAVRAYFDNGGSRLYVSRVFSRSVDPNSLQEDEGVSSASIINNADADLAASFISRFPGVAGNGRISVRQGEAPATAASMRRAPVGTMVRVTDVPAGPARLTSTKSPVFSLNNGDVLNLVTNDGPVKITFNGRRAEATAAQALGAGTVLDNTNNTLTVTIDGVAQTITLPPTPDPVDPYTPEEIALLINDQLRAGSARLSTAAPPNRLIISSDRRGSSARVAVNSENATLGFTGPLPSAQNQANADNNVADLSRVTAAEIDALLQGKGVNASVSSEDEGGRLVLTTEDTGAASSIEVQGPAVGENSANQALGFVTNQSGEGSPAAALAYYVKRGNDYVNDADDTLPLANIEALEPATEEDAPKFLTLSIFAVDGDEKLMTYEDMGFDRTHPRWVGYVLAEQPSRRIDALENTFGLRIGSDVTGFALRSAFFTNDDTRVYELTNGDDGTAPTAANYATALQLFESIEDIAIIAGPGHSTYQDFMGIQGELIKHVEKRRSYRMAVLDTPPQQTIGEARSVRSRIDSKYAALYYPWVVVSNPLARPGVESIPREISLPPSGFVCGVYARNDVERGVFKAPANEVVRGALRFETDINFAQQEVLNPLGINCLRYFPGRGNRVWGARTVSSDPEWKYVNVRRYFLYLENSIDRGTQWSVFEPNGERLWANVRETVSSFLYNEWRSGALLGTSPKEAFFVRCDRSTMTQNDLDNGRLICLVGVAVIKPAEFVIFRIGQKTADSRS